MKTNSEITKSVKQKHLSESDLESPPCKWWEKTNHSDIICNKDEENIVTTLDLWESIGIIATVCGILLLLILIVRLKQVIFLCNKNCNIHSFIKVVEGKKSCFLNTRVKQSYIDFLPDYESVLQMDEEENGLPSYRTAVGEDINS